jgi:hypothetical protein
MGPKMRRCLVIDASVASAAGESDDPDSIRCREFLEKVFLICHKMVLSRALLEEWERHESDFARTWRAGMTDKRKVLPVAAKNQAGLIQEIDRLGSSSKKKKEMSKDAHLLSAATESDHIVVSLDDTAKFMFAELSGSVTGVVDVVWVNPSHPDEDAIAWVKAGAKNEQKRQLSNYRRGA